MTNKADQRVENEAAFRQIDRLINFSDGVLAIAVTLLILPLVDRASELQPTSFTQLWDLVGQQFLIFLLSFVVICSFWIGHHNLLHSLQKFNPAIFWLNALWLLSIVLIPFPTELIGRADSGNGSLVSGIYIANLLLATVAGLAIQWQIKKSPQLQKPNSKPPVLAESYATVLLTSLALIIAVAVPEIGPWSLFLLFLTGRVSRLFRRGTVLD